MKWWINRKLERILGHKLFWRIARQIKWFDLSQYYGCKKKIDFKSGKRAIESAQRMNESGKARNELESYHCEYCNGWHIGRKKNDQNKRKIRNLSLV